MRDSAGPRRRAIATAIGDIVRREVPGASLADWRIRPSESASSARLSEIDVELSDGAVLRLILKESGRRARLPVAPKRIARSVRDPRREIGVYERLLAGADLGTPRLYGSVQDAAADRYWLFLERIDGTELRWSVRPALLPRVGAWLARAHAALGEIDTSGVPLLRHDAAYYRRWLDRARRATRADDATRRARLTWIARRYGSVIEALESMPASFIHGEFYPSNILVDDSRPDGRIAVVDWEMAAIGPAVIDLAALIEGGYAEDVRQSMVDAYRAEISPGDRAWRSATEPEPLLYARLHLAIQWLGWAPGWSPPAEQRHDWLAEAVELGKRLGW